MKPHRGLIHKINRAFIIQGLFISIAALLSVFFAKVVLEETLIKEAIQQEAEYFWERYQSDDTFPLPDTQNLTGYFDIEHLPEEIKTGLPLTQGFHESSEQHIVVYKTRQGDHDLYLLYYRDQVDSLAIYYGLFPLTLIFLYATTWFSYRFSRRMVSPVSWLANQVNRIDFSAKQISPINLDEIPFETDDEIQLLANSIVHLGERVDNFIERERNFTRDASHELRSPLTVIRIATDMLQSEHSLSELASNSLQKIRRAADDMEDLTEAFLLLARESDDALLMEAVNVNDIVKQEIERTKPFNRLKNIPVSVTEHHVLVITASDKVLSILLGNLIRNAILYTDTGAIKITITEKSVIIEDSGIGMSKEEINKIFIPHYRASNNASIGHGVGLTIVKRLSERFHWLLEINSFPGKGTRIEVSF
ncbi:MAG: HAMP domain-containing sensor histidine kinase [Gammaproteobacteria bacterium]|nr:HAMP domain-containing sensor histidine kinase [Gammaproteobacteria bacterium]